MANFKVGQKVVCVRPGTASNDFGGRTEVEKDKIYTVQVSEFMSETPRNFAGHIVKLKEVEGKWLSDRFEPLKEQYQSASSEILAKFTLTEEKADVQIKEVPQKQTI